MNMVVAAPVAEQHCDVSIERQTESNLDLRSS